MHEVKLGCAAAPFGRASHIGSGLGCFQTEPAKLIDRLGA